MTTRWLCISTSVSSPSPLLFLFCIVVAPQGLQLLKSTEDSLLVSWEPSSEVDHYLLSYYPLGQELSGKQIQVPKEQHTYDIVGLQPGTKYIVTLRNVKKEVSSGPQHLLATTGEEAVGCLRFPRKGPILNVFFHCSHKYPSTTQNIALIWQLKNVAVAILVSGEKSQFLLPFLGSCKSVIEPAGLGLKGSSPRLRLVRSDCPAATHKQPRSIPVHPGPH